MACVLDMKELTPSMTVSQWDKLPTWCYQINSSPLGQDGRHIADDFCRCVSVNEKFCILIKISLKFVPKGPIGNYPALD